MYIPSVSAPSVIKLCAFNVNGVNGKEPELENLVNDLDPMFLV